MMNFINSFRMNFLLLIYWQLSLLQILPYYVTQVGGKIPGLPGLFIAGIFAAGLSSMSSNMNTLSGVIYDDFIKP